MSDAPSNHVEPITSGDLATLEKLCEGATPGPWDFNMTWGIYAKHGSDVPRPPGLYVITRAADTHMEHSDAALIAAARNHMGALLAEVRASRTAARQHHDVEKIIRSTAGWVCGAFIADCPGRDPDVACPHVQGAVEVLGWRFAARQQGEPPPPSPSPSAVSK